MPKSRRPSSSGSRSSRNTPTKPTHSSKLGVPYEALKTFLARSLEREYVDPSIGPAIDPVLDPALGAVLDVGTEDDEIDYGPAISALHDLAAWALEIAERDVRDWPEAQRRVRCARRFVLARIRGARARRVPYEDVIFTAGLLVRIFDDDLALGMSEMVAIFDALGLPTELVPIVPRNASAASAKQPSPSPQAAHRPRPSGGQPARLSCCDDCGYFHSPLWPHVRNAA